MTTDIGLPIAIIVLATIAFLLISSGCVTAPVSDKRAISIEMDVNGEPTHPNARSR